ncbi:uncharacterized protein LOC112060789 [Chrysemys picta bellii]|uniref:uncharacterized protein LOC112060789 n=1 Tax=Chrysemys picta bellii TaxID=8478 RepID=UPI0032B19F40
MGGPGAGRGAPAVALLAVLASALLIPETGSLRCHSHSSVLLRDRGGKHLDSVVTHNGTESCAPAHGACMEAAVTLSAGGMSVTLIQRGCRDGHPKGGTEPPAAPSRFLHIQADVRYCQSDQCNAKGLGLGRPGQGTASAPSGPTQCYAGLSLGPQPHTLERVTCDGGRRPLLPWQCHPQSREAHGAHLRVELPGPVLRRAGQPPRRPPAPQPGRRLLLRQLLQRAEGPGTGLWKRQR